MLTVFSAACHRNLPASGLWLPEQHLNYCRIWQTWDPRPRPAASIPNSLEHQGGVRPPKTEGIRQGDPDFAPFGRLWDQIDPGFHRRIVEIDRRRRHLIADRKNRKNRLDRPRRTQEVANG